MGRVEYKYLVPVSQIDRLRNCMLPYMKLDGYCALQRDKEYTVRSIYFDTPRLAYYHDKLAGIRERKKVRIRGYNEPYPGGSIFLEIKRKHGPVIRKLRAKIEFSVLNYLLDGYRKKNAVFPEINEDTNHFLYHVLSSQLKPLIKIVYEREAFFFKFNDGLRITIDKNIRSSLSSGLQSLYTEDTMIPCFKKHHILEIKTAEQFPKWLSEILAKFSMQNEALSKYTLSLDTHREYNSNLDKLFFQNKRYLNYYAFAN